MITWFGFFPAVGITSDVELEIVAEAGHTIWDVDERLAMVEVARGNDSVEIIGFNLIFVVGGEEVRHFVVGDLDANSVGIYYVDLSGYDGDLTEIRLAPVFVDGEEGKVSSRFKVNDRWKFSNVSEIEGVVVPVSSGSSSGGGGSSGGGSSSVTPVVTDPVVCVENWSYSEWGDCVGGVRLRNASDSNSCGSVADRLALSEGCESAECVVDGDCDSGDYCNNGNCVPVGSECVVDSDCVYRGPGFVCNSGSECGWDAPIGIPVPEFGIEETYRMYDLEENRNSALTYTENSEGGFYTHYVDNTHVNSTDGNSPGIGDYSVLDNFGTIEKPRKTVPGDIPEGSVVEIHGGPYEYGHISSGYRIPPFKSAGTMTSPVFIRGFSSTSQIRFNKTSVKLEGTYLIVENILLTNGWFQPQYTHDPILYPNYVSLRNIEIYGGPEMNAAAINAKGNNMVIYNCHIHDNGNPLSENENDFHGVFTGKYSGPAWIVDNYIHENGGDSIQINSGANPLDELARYIYIGRNIMHGDGENAIDLKQCRDVIISENQMYGYRPSPFSGGSDGTPMIINDDLPHETIWIINNKIWNSSHGMRLQDAGYVLGNVVYDILGNGMTMYGSTGNISIVSNTFYNTGWGIKYGSGGATSSLKIENNIVVNVTVPSATHVELPYFTLAGNSTMNHNLVFQLGGYSKIRWGISSSENLTQFQTRTGKGEGCMEVDPLFIDSENGNFSLLSGSLAINSGIESDTYQTFHDLYGIDIKKDVEGVVRPQGSGWDIGAYEYS